MRIIENGDLTGANSFAVRATARYLVVLDQATDILRLREQPRIRDLPLLILGGGSNVLFRSDYEGVVVLLRSQGVELLDCDQSHWYLRAEAGESWHSLVLWSLDRRYPGLENLSLIPGRVGAAAIQNIGAYGVELKDRFHSLEAVALSDGNVHTFPLEACKFGYRSSVFKGPQGRDFLIGSVTLRLPRQPQYRLDYLGVKEALQAQPRGELLARRISRAVCAIRRAKLPDPKRLGNAGSFFKNPTVSSEHLDKLRSKHGDIPAFPQTRGGHKLSAAWLIEACGWKGHRRGDAGVFRKHALVLVNYEAATGQQLWRLARDIQDSVAETFGLTLEPEVTVI